MGIPLWESPPDAKTLDKSSATNRCDVHTVAHTSPGSSSRPAASSSTNPSTSRAGGINLPYEYIFAGSRPIRRHILDPAADNIEIEDLQNERDHETQIRERERERERERDRDHGIPIRIERNRRERGERRSAHMERFLNASYHTPQLPTTSTTSQRPRPHMIQPSSDQLLTLSEFLRDTPSGQSRSNNNSSNNAQAPTASETSAIQQWLGLRGTNATRTSNERREAWERALSPGAIPSALTPASAVVSTSNAAATISNPHSAHRRSQSTSADWPPSSPSNNTSPNNRSDSFQTLVNQIRRIGALQDYMLNTVDESAASLEESLNLHSQALNRAINTHNQSTQPSSSTPREPISSNTSIPDVNSLSYYTSLRVREARIRTMQSRIDLLASEFALLRTTRRELRRAESEALNMFQTTGAVTSAVATAAIEIPTVHSSMPREISRDQDPIRTEVDEVDEALDAEGNSSRRVLRSTFLPAELGDEAIIHFEREAGRSRVRDTLAEARREIEAEQARSMEVMQEARRMIAARTNANNNAINESSGEEDAQGGRRRRRVSIESIERSQSEGRI